MGDEVMTSEYPNANQRSAVCYAQWDKRDMAKQYELIKDIFAVGKWNGAEFTAEDLNLIATAFNKLKDVHNVPLKLGHNEEQPMTDGQPRLGRVAEVWKEGNKLFAKFVDMPRVVYEAIKQKLYNNVSIELDIGVEHQENYYPYVLSGVALLGADIPAVNTLDDLQAFMSRGDKLHAANHMQFAVDTGNLNREVLDMAEVEKLQAEIETLKATIEAKDEKIATFSKTTTDLESRLEKMEAEEDQRKADEQKATFAREKEDVAKRLEELVKSKVITPAQRESFMAGWKEDDATIGNMKFSIDVLEKGAPKIEDDQQGRNDNTHESGLSPDELVAQRTHEYMRTQNVNFSTAMKSVLASDKELARDYQSMNGLKGE
jgi:hypothetical protein